MSSLPLGNNLGLKHRIGITVDANSKDKQNLGPARGARHGETSDEMMNEHTALEVVRSPQLQHDPDRRYTRASEQVYFNFFFRLLISVTAAEMQKHQNGPLPQQLTKWVIACNGAIVGFLMSLEADVLEAGRAGLLSSSELRAIGDRTYVTRCSTNDVEESA